MSFPAYSLLMFTAVLFHLRLSHPLDKQDAADSAWPHLTTAIVLVSVIPGEWRLAVLLGFVAAYAGMGISQIRTQSKIGRSWQNSPDTATLFKDC